MNALLLSAGHGTRLRPITDSMPKCLVPIAGKPLLQRWFELLFDGGIERILVNTHYLENAVRSFVETSKWHQMVDLVHEDELLGTAGTLRANRRYFGSEGGLLAHADNLTSFDVGDFIRHHAFRADGVEITMMTFEAENPSECGIVTEDCRGVVTAFVEKHPDPSGTRANAAVYLFQPSVLDFLDTLPGMTLDFSTEVLPQYLGRIQTYFNDSYHRDIGTPASLARAREDFARAE